MKILSKYQWPVVCQMPAEGGWREESFTATFRVVSVDELIAADETPTGGSDLALRALTDWSGIEDADGNPFPYSEVNKEELAQLPHVRAAIIEAFRDSALNRQNREKN